MPRGGRQIDRLHRIAADQVRDVQALGELDQIAVVDEVAGAPATLEIGHVGGAADHGEVDPVLADPGVTLGIAGVQGEGAGRRPDPLLDECRIEAHARPRRLDLAAGLGEDRARLRQQEIHADLGEHPQRCGVDRLDLVGGHDLERRERVAQALERQLRQADCGPITPWSPSFSGHSSTCPLARRHAIAGRAMSTSGGSRQS
jgi:hypothetical protein